MEQFIIANLAPIMFGALVVFLLSGFPVAFSLAANGLFFGLVGIELGLLRTGSSASWPTTRCWRFPSSPSWA